MFLKEREGEEEDSEEDSEESGRGGTGWSFE